MAFSTSPVALTKLITKWCSLGTGGCAWNQRPLKVYERWPSVTTMLHCGTGPRRSCSAISALDTESAVITPK